MFKPSHERRIAGHIEFEGSRIPFSEADSLAAALLGAGVAEIRSNPVDSSPRAPYCLMGICFECLVEVDGVQNRQACMIRARDGMVVRRQRGARRLA